MTMAEVEDKIVKDVLMHGFKADERTCSEAKLRFLMQQKTSLIDQWRYTRTGLLKELTRKLDQIDRKDVESLVQIPSGDDEALNEIDEDDLLEEDEDEEEDEESEEESETEHLLDNGYQSNVLNEIQEENEDEYEEENIGENQLSPINEQHEMANNVEASIHTDLPSYKSNQSPILTPVLNAVASENEMDRLRQRIANLESYVKREVAEIKQDLHNLS